MVLDLQGQDVCSRAIKPQRAAELEAFRLAQGRGVCRLGAFEFRLSGAGITLRNGRLVLPPGFNLVLDSADMRLVDVTVVGTIISRLVGEV